MNDGRGDFKADRCKKKKKKSPLHSNGDEKKKHNELGFSEEMRGRKILETDFEFFFRGNYAWGFDGPLILQKA